MDPNEKALGSLLAFIGQDKTVKPEQKKALEKPVADNKNKNVVLDLEALKYECED